MEGDRSTAFEFQNPRNHTNSISNCFLITLIIQGYVERNNFLLWQKKKKNLFLEEKPQNKKACYMNIKPSGLSDISYRYH